MGRDVAERSILAIKLKVDRRGEGALENKGNFGLDVKTLAVFPVVLPVKANGLSTVEDVVESQVEVAVEEQVS